MISSARARRVSAAVAATVLGLSVVATAAPASADSRTLKDGKGDTWLVSGAEPEKKAGHPEGDLRKVVIKHTARKLVVTARFQNLQKSGNGVALQAQIDTPGDIIYGVSAFGEPGNWKGEAALYGSPEACSVGHTMNYRKDVISVSVPSRCLERPDWVKLEVYGLFEKSDSKFFVDNAHNGKLDGEYTRRIERG